MELSQTFSKEPLLGEVNSSKHNESSLSSSSLPKSESPSSCPLLLRIRKNDIIKEIKDLRKIVDNQK